MGAGDGHEGGETVEAGLPNLEGHFYARPHMTGNKTSGGPIVYGDGKLFTHLIQGSDYIDNSMEETSNVYKDDKVSFNASAFNAIYGRSDTVQPPAYYFYFWRRVS